MIPFPRSHAESNSSVPAIRVIGLGNAGVNLADRLVMSGLPATVVAMNSDQQSLASSVAAAKISIGSKATRGLGAGGDPEVGWEAARESADLIRESVEGAAIVFLCAGLGGGTASGAAPLVAEIAKEQGALLIGVFTSPFAFEGKRRAQQAAETLQAVARRADAIVHFENDRMASLVSPKSGMEATFAASDELLENCIRAIAGVITGQGPMRVGIPELLAVLRDGEALCLFGHGEAIGDNRAHDASARALKSPLLDRGRLLDEAGSLLVHVSGPSTLSFAEVNAIMGEISRHTAENARIFLGFNTQGNADAPVTVTLLGKCQRLAAEKIEPAPMPRTVRAPQAQPVMPPPSVRQEKPPTASEPAEEKELIPAQEISAPAPIPAAEPEPVPAPKAAAKKPPQKATQETLQFEPATRGRFEKSEPTIIEGEDLDVPTFLRMKIKGK